MEKSCSTMLSHTFILPPQTSHTNAHFAHNIKLYLTKMRIALNYIASERRIYSWRSRYTQNKFVTPSEQIPTMADGTNTHTTGIE